MYDNGILHFWNLLCDSHTSSKILHVLLYLNLKIVSYELVRIFQMFKLVLEKAEEPEIKLPISAGSLKKKESQKNIYLCFIDYAKAFDCVDHNKLVENS